MKTVVLSVYVLLLIGCQSNKLTEASGSWTPVNKMSFEPPITDAERVKVYGCRTNNPATCK